MLKMNYFNPFLKITIPILLLIVLLINCGCSKSAKATAGLKLINKYKLNVQEPSGLALSRDGKFLWTVSDNWARIYKIALNGLMLDSIDVDGYDIEGICNYEDGLLYICERTREIVHVDSSWNEVSRKSLDLEGELNSGLEGIAANSAERKIFAVNEKAPVLLLELDSNMTIVKKRELNLAKDLSGMEYDTGRNELWLLSDESSSLFRCDSTGKELNGFKLDIRQPEGIAIDFSNKLIYIVSDFEETLYVLKQNEETAKP